jgi:hypothetical protein
MPARPSPAGLLFLVYSFSDRYKVAAKYVGNRQYIRLEQIPPRIKKPSVDGYMSLFVYLFTCCFSVVQSQACGNARIEDSEPPQPCHQGIVLAHLPTP